MASALEGGGVFRMEPGVRIHSVPPGHSTHSGEPREQRATVSSCILWAQRRKQGSQGLAHWKNGVFPSMTVKYMRKQPKRRVNCHKVLEGSILWVHGPYDG